MSAHFYPVILAGGRGTRFWPLSRKKRAKQLLALDGKQTMIQQTVVRLLGLAPAKQFWIITNEELRAEILRQLRKLRKDQIVAEPVGRNTAPAIGLAAFILQRTDPDAVLGLFPSDHVVGDETRFHEVIREGVEIAASGENIPPPRSIGGGGAPAKQKGPRPDKLDRPDKFERPDKPPKLDKGR